MIVSFDGLAEVRKKHRGQKIVLAAGSFDLTHAGHALFLERSKGLGDVLVVMVGSDAAIVRLKGPDRPILDERLRLTMIDFLKPVDYSFIDCYDGCKDRPDFIVVMMDEAFRVLKPDMLVVNNDRDDISWREELGRKHGVKIVVSPRINPTEYDDFSTTTIIEKIRDLARKEA